MTGTSSSETSASISGDENECAKESSLQVLLKSLQSSGNGSSHLPASKRRKTSEAEDSESTDIEEDCESDFEEEGSKHSTSSSMEDFNGDADSECSDGAGEEKIDQHPDKISQFHAHLTHAMTKLEADSLLELDLKYRWKRPAFSSSTSKWKGTGDCYQEEDKCNFYGLKMKLYHHWIECYNKSGGGRDFDSSVQREFFSICNSYMDVMHCDKKGFYMKGAYQDSCMMDGYLMHSLNHVYKTRTLVTKNDAKFARNQEHTEEEMLHGGGFLDRGFTRPKVLLLLPLRNIAFRVVERLILLTPPSHKINVENFDRFLREYGNQSDDNNDSNELTSEGPAKPLDFQVLFGGNISEEFMIGIKFTRGSIKLYSDFYSSDIILASPVQLVHAIGRAEAETDKDIDYLSSIEVMIIDHADIIAMQNWSHVNSILEQLNKIPSDQHGTDVMRVRPWYLDGYARFYRQTILLGSFLTPDMNASFNRLCLNYEGKLKYVLNHEGVIGNIMLPIVQVFERFDTSIAKTNDDRFNYFVTKVFPKIKNSIQGGTMIFISCYFDFVRMRNFLKSQNASFCLLGEYTKHSDISRARGWFYKGQRRIMLYTERAHFYHRYKIRGIKNLIFYSIPERKEFYPEIINMLDGVTSMSCSVLFSKFDNMQLERIVGSTYSKSMITSDKHMFVVGQGS